MKKKDRIAKKARKRSERRWRRLLRDPRLEALARENIGGLLRKEALIPSILLKSVEVNPLDPSVIDVVVVVDRETADRMALHREEKP